MEKKDNNTLGKFIFNSALLKMCDGHVGAAILLAYVISEVKKRRYTKGKKASFASTDADVMTALGNSFPVNKLTLAKNKLRRLPFITIKPLGHPPVTHYIIDMAAYKVALEVANQTKKEPKKDEL